MRTKKRAIERSTVPFPIKENQRARNGRSSDDAPLKIAIAYQSVATALRAKAVLERLMHALGPDFVMDSSFWGFAALEIRGLREEAAREAAQSDLLVISAHKITELPAQVTMWFELSLMQREDRAGALMVLHEDTTAALRDSPVYPYLHQVVQISNLELFLSASSESDNAANLLTAELAQPIEVRTSVPDAVLSQTRGVPRWGINE